jgi:excisionase family DNA binding protein
VTGLLTAREVAALLGVHSETVLRYVRSGRIPAIRLPSEAVRFREGELEASLTERATPYRGGVQQPRKTSPVAILVPVQQPPIVEE